MADRMQDSTTDPVALMAAPTAMLDSQAAVNVATVAMDQTAAEPAAPQQQLPPAAAASPIPIPGPSRTPQPPSTDAGDDAGPLSPIAPADAATAAAVEGPPDPLGADTLGALLQRASPQVNDTRFSMTDLVRNPDLQKAARRELEGCKPPSTLEDDPGAALDNNGHDAEIERQRAVLRELDRTVMDEMTVNADLVKLVLDRIDSGKQALDGVVQLLTVMAQLEQQRASSLNSAAKLPLHGPTDGPTLQAAARQLVQLPLQLAAVHQKLQEQAQVLLGPLQALQGRYAAAGKDVRSRAQAAARGVDSSRRQMGQYFQQHRAACLAFDQAAEGGRGASSALLLGRLDTDPWDSEARLVMEQRTLLKQQEAERQLVAEALSSSIELEAERVSAVTAVTQQLLAHYIQQLGQLPEQLAALAPSEQAAAAAEAQAPGQVADLQRMAADTATAGQQLAARQSAALEDVVQELFCSPEITRQGEMERWDPRSSTWQRRHFVLTRAGYLHCFERMADDARCDALKLTRCEVEQGEAPVINLTETGIGSWLGRGSKKCILKAGSVEEYCEWALALREAIALSSGKRSSSNAGRG